MYTILNIRYSEVICILIAAKGEDIDNDNRESAHDPVESDLGRLQTPKYIMQSAKVYVLSKKKEVYVSYWDLGGDEPYYATHHIHLSPDAVYLLVFDMSACTTQDERKRQLGIFFSLFIY